MKGLKGLIVTHRGAEQVACQEVSDLLQQKAKVEEQAVIFFIKNKEELCLLCYKAQAAIKVLLLLVESDVDFELVRKELSKVKLKEWLHNKTFAVRCMKQGHEDLHTPEIEGKIGEILVELCEQQKIKTKVSLEDPDVTVFCFLSEKKLYIGIDFAGFDLSKRYYKIFQHPETLKGTIGYTLLRIAGYTAGQLLVDPFCGSGIIPIEAACFSYNFPVHFYAKDKFAFLKFMKFDFSKIDKKIKKPGKITIFGFDHNVRYVDVAKKNATIAGVNKYISFSRIAVEWHDTKLGEHSVDLIAGNPPSASHVVDKKEIEKLYHELFYQADFVLSKKGKIVLAARDTELAIPAAEKYKFKVVDEKVVYSSKLGLKVLVFARA